MFRKKDDEKLMQLQQELLAVEEEEEYEAYDQEDFSDYIEDPAGEPEEDEDFTAEYTDDGEQSPSTFATGYRRGSPRQFDDNDFFDGDDFDDEDVLYQKDYRKALKKKRRQNFGLAILAVLEILAIAAIVLWWMSWM